MGICDPTGTLEEDEVYVHHGLGTVRYIHLCSIFNFSLKFSLDSLTLLSTSLPSSLLQPNNAFLIIFLLLLLLLLLNRQFSGLNGYKILPEGQKVIVTRFPLLRPESILLLTITKTEKLDLFFNVKKNPKECSREHSEESFVSLLGGVVVFSTKCNENSESEHTYFDVFPIFLCICDF